MLDDTNVWPCIVIWYSTCRNQTGDLIAFATAAGTEQDQQALLGEDELVVLASARGGRVWRVPPTASAWPSSRSPADGAGYRPCAASREGSSPWSKNSYAALVQQNWRLEHVLDSARSPWSNDWQPGGPIAGSVSLSVKPVRSRDLSPVAVARACGFAVTASAAADSHRLLSRKVHQSPSPW